MRKARRDQGYGKAAVPSQWPVDQLFLSVRVRLSAATKVSRCWTPELLKLTQVVGRMSRCLLHPRQRGGQDRTGYRLYV